MKEGRRKAEKRIEDEIKRYEKLALPSDRIRWKWGVLDGLDIALKIMREEELNDEIDDRRQAQ